MNLISVAFDTLAHAIYFFRPFDFTLAALNRLQHPGYNAHLLVEYELLLEKTLLSKSWDNLATLLNSMKTIVCCYMLYYAVFFLGKGIGMKTLLRKFIFYIEAALLCPNSLFIKFKLLNTVSNTAACYVLNESSWTSTLYF